MARIPYSPVQQVGVSQEATPSVSDRATSAAFGSDVAGAIGNLGKAVEGAGNEIYARAMAFQQLANETEAREADSNYMIAAGELHAEFNTLQGKAAVDAYPQYAKNLQELRVRMRDGLSNPTAAKMFDAQSISTMGRSIFNGAGYAARENKAWAVGTITSQISLDAKTVEDNPNDDRLFQDKIDRVREGAQSLAGLQGMEPGSPQEKELSLKATSQLWAQRITGMARTAPFEAATFLDKHKTEMTQADYLKVDGIVRTQGRAVGATNIANDVFAVSEGLTLAQLEDQARAAAKALAPDDPILEKQAVAAVQGKYNQDKYAAGQQKLDDVQTVRNAVREGPTGQGVKTEQELLQIPGMAEVIQRLPASERNGIQGYINRFNKARDQVTNDETKLRLNGLFNNPDTREEALNIDLTAQKLSMPDMIRFQDKQAKLRKDTEGDPRVARAVGWMQQSMGTQLEALGVYRRTEANKDLYDKFRGSVQVGIDTFIEDNKRPPNYKEFMDQIAPRLLQTRDTSKTYLGYIWPTDTPFFDRANDAQFERFSTRMRADFDSRQMAPPSESEIYKAYVRSLYTKEYGKKDKAR